MSGLNLRLSLVMLLLCRCVVEPTASTDPSGLAPRLVSNTYYGEDGSVLGKAETYDSKLKVPCAVLPAQDGKLRCLPQTEALILYLDAGCTQSLLAARPHSCTSAPQYALQPLFNTSCAYGPVLTRWAPYFVGAAVAAPVRAYSSNTGRCLEVAAETFDFFQALALSPSDFVAVTPK